MAADYVAVSCSLLKWRSISERETTVADAMAGIGKKVEGQGLNSDRAHRVAETDALNLISLQALVIGTDDLSIRDSSVVDTAL